MEYTNFLQSQNISSLDEIKKVLSEKPYCLRFKVDSDLPNLYLVTYTRGESDMNIPVVRECNGLVVEKDSNKIICQSFNKTADRKEHLKYILPDYTKCKLEELNEGTLIRLFYYNNKWNYATKGCLMAKKSFWNSKKSFYEMFVDTLSRYKLDIDDNLDTKMCYAFVIKHPENKYIANYTSPSLVHVLTRNMETLEEVDVNLGVEKPAHSEFTNIDDLNETLKTMTTTQIEGYMLIDDKYKRQKFRSDVYQNAKDLLGNTNNLFFRYLDLRKDEELLKNYINFFPESKQDFIGYEKDIINLGKTIHTTYLNKRVYKTIQQVPFQFKKTLYKLHGNYLRTNDVVTLTSVMEELDSLDSKLLCFIYNKTIEQQVVVHNSLNYQLTHNEEFNFTNNELVVDGDAMDTQQTTYAQVVANQPTEQVT